MTPEGWLQELQTLKESKDRIRTILRFKADKSHYLSELQYCTERIVYVESQLDRCFDLRDNVRCSDCKCKKSK